MARRSAIVAAVLACSVATSGAALAPVPSAHDVTTEETVVDDSRLVMLLDASGSMAEPDATGAPRIDAARSALRASIDALPDDAEVGFRVFGARIVGQETAGACEDTQQIVPVGPVDRASLTAAVDAYAPYGETPIGAGLLGAADDLGDTGQRSILLVSDGLSNCEPDPCDVASALEGVGVELVVNVVGLNVGADARAQLQCIADATGGTYFDATDTETLTSALTQVSTRAYRPFAFAGTPVEGSATAAGAASLTDGDWLSAVTPETSYFLVERQQPGSTLRIGTVSRNTTTAVATYTLTAETPAGEECGFDSGVAVGGEEAGRLAFSSVVLAQDEVAECMEGDVVIAIEGDAELAGQPLEIRVYEEPPILSPDRLPPAETESPLDVEALAGVAGNVEDVVPGSSTSDAPEIEPGNGYALDIVPGETQTFAVELDWGQAMSVRAQFDDTGLATNALQMDVEVYDPYFAEVSGVYGEFVVIPGTFDAIGVAIPTVRASNAAAECTVTCPSIAGTYLVVVRSQVRTTVEPGFMVPYVLAIDVAGTAGEGAPQYASAVETTTPAPETDTPAPSASRSEGDAGPEGPNLGIIVAAIAIGILIVLAVSVGVVLLILRRRRNTSS